MIYPFDTSKLKTVVKTELPPCVFCSNTAAYDAPTSQGPWGYLCERCFAENACSKRIGASYRLTTVNTPEIDLETRIALAVEEGDFDLAETLVGDGDLLDYL